VASDLGMTQIPAFVTEVISPVPLNKDSDVDQMIVAAERIEFFQRTGLDRSRPEADFKVSVPDAYHSLLDHITVHQYFMGIDGVPAESFAFAAEHWYDHVYVPVVDAIREYRILGEFPDRTEADWRRRGEPRRVRPRLDEVGKAVPVEVCEEEAALAVGGSVELGLIERQRGSERRIRDPSGSGVEPGADRQSGVGWIGVVGAVPARARVGDVVVNEECMPPWYVWLNEPSSDKDRRMLVSFDEHPHDGGRVNHLHAGASEGC